VSTEPAAAQNASDALAKLVSPVAPPKINGASVCTYCSHALKHSNGRSFHWQQPPWIDFGWTWLVALPCPSTIEKRASTGGKQKLGATSKMGERTLRRLLIIGSSAVVKQASKRGARRGSWLEQMLARKPRMLVTVALANKMARIVWALLVKRETYRAPVAARA